LPNVRAQVAAGGDGSGAACAGACGKVSAVVKTAGMRIGVHCWEVASDAYNESWTVWLCFAAVVSVGNYGGHTVCGGCCCGLRG